ncbi:transglycosylase SLT domain-containing protein [Escherichia coli]|nr:transglycosylase SLT domain-containing protein [Escherichia coli]
MGGLVSGAAGLLSSGASAIGLDGVAKALDFDTSDIAKLIDKGVGDSISAVKSVTDAIGITNSDKNADERNKTLVETVKKGASDTINAINRLVDNGVSATRQIFTGKPNNAPVAVGDIKVPRPTSTGKMQLDTMAGKFAALEQQHGLPPGLLRAVATTESGGDNGAVSHAGAKGMFQFMPKTAAEYGLIGEDVYDPDKSAAAAAKKLSGLVKLYNGDVGLALSAYNWGEGNIQRKGMGAAPKETREYAPKVFAAMQAAGAAAPSTAINYAQATGANDNSVAAATTDPTQQAPAQQVQPVASASNNPLFTPGKLPTDEAGAKSLIGDTTIEAVVDKLGGDRIRNAEGNRHQVSAADILALQSGQTPQSQQKVQEAKEATAQATAVATGSMFSQAKLPTDSQALKDMPGGEFIGKVISDYGGDKIANAEGLRHQASASEIQDMQLGIAPAKATQSKQNVQPAALAIPSKIPSVKDMTASQMKSTVNVANEVALPKSLTNTWDKILKRLDEIAGHTKDTAEKTGDSSPKANTPQPAPRTSVPLSIEDPLINEVANN